MNHRRVILLLPVVLLLAADGVVLADEKKQVEVQVWAIRATTRNSEVSPELGELADVLKKQFKYTGFKLEKKSDGRVATGEAFSTDLIGGYKISVTPKTRSEKKLELEVKVSQKGRAVLNTTVTVSLRKFLPIGCGKLADDDYLITAVRAR